MRFCQLWVVGFLSVCVSPAYSQSPADSLNNEPVSAFRNIYFQEIKDNALLYEGRKYDVDTKRADGFPYFQADVIRHGTITYQGTRYAPVRLYYDLVFDKVIISNYERDGLMTLDSEKIDSFSIGTHVFVALPRSNGLPKRGFYELLHAGEPGLYASREKKFYFGTGNQESRYVEKNSYFVLRHSIFYRCDSKAEMLTVFSDHEPALKKYIHSNKIDFREDYESAILRCIVYYEGLIH
jgi:hypothetical protein